MAKAPNKLARVRQVYHWMVDQYPTPWPTVLRLSPFEGKLKGLNGFCFKDGKRLVVMVNPKISLSYMLDVLAHEYAHAMTWRLDGSLPDHNAYWGVALADIECGYNDTGGDKESRDYPWD